MIRGAIIAQWIRLCLPSCHPGFEYKAHHLRFHQFIELCNVEKTKINRKDAQTGPFLKNKSSQVGRQVAWCQQVLAQYDSFLIDRLPICCLSLKNNLPNSFVCILLTKTKRYLQRWNLLLIGHHQNVPKKVDLGDRSLFSVCPWSSLVQEDEQLDWPNSQT